MFNPVMVNSIAADFFGFDETRGKNMEYWQKEQLKVATGVTSPQEGTHSTVYISIIEELETENRMLRARNERLTMAMKKLERILQENLR